MSNNSTRSYAFWQMLSHLLPAHPCKVMKGRVTTFVMYHCIRRGIVAREGVKYFACNGAISGKAETGVPDFKFHIQSASESQGF